MDELLLLLRIFLFGVFALAGVAKLLDPEGSEKAVKGFGVPEDLAKPVAFLLPVSEIVIALMLLARTTAWFGAILALLLLLVFIGGMLVQIAKGNAPDCHCFGQLHSEPVGKSSLIRNVGFAALALFLVGQGRDNQGLGLTQFSDDMLQAVFLLGILVLMAVAVFYLKKIFEQQVQIQRHIEVLEVISRDGASVARDEAGTPTESLPIGAPFPDFELADTAGKKVKMSDLRSQQKASLFLFVGPDCGPCNALYPEVGEWQRSLAEKFSILLVSSGGVSENVEKFGTEHPVLLQEKRELADQVKARWTPTAVYVNADGKIASHPAAGDVAIRELVGKLSTSDLAKEFTIFPNENNQAPVKIGEEIPKFQFRDIKDVSITDEHLRGKHSMVLFFSPTCPHCVNMVEDLKEWDTTKGKDDPELLVFSDGDVEDNTAFGLKSHILLDKHHKFSNTIGMYGTPSAVLVNEKGEIITETGVGAANVWALIGKTRPNGNS